MSTPNIHNVIHQESKKILCTIKWELTQNKTHLVFKMCAGPQTLKYWPTATTAVVKNSPWHFCQLVACLSFICRVILLFVFVILLFFFVRLCFLFHSFVFLCSERHPLLVASIHWLTRGEWWRKRFCKSQFLKTSIDTPLQKSLNKWRT